MKTKEEYLELTHGEVRHLAAEGDPVAQQILDDARAEIQEMYNSAPPTSLGGYMRNIDRFLAGDMDAAREMVKYQYSRGKLFYYKRWNRIREYVDQRFTEENTDEDKEKAYGTWWSDNIVIPAMALVLFNPRIDKLRMTKVYGVTRGRIGREIERDLTGGLTTDQKEFLQVLLFLDMIPGYDEENQNPQDEQISQSDFEENFLALLKGLEMREAENWLIIKQKFDRLSNEDVLTVLQPILGDDEQLAKKLGISIGALRTRRNRIIGKIKKN